MGNPPCGDRPELRRAPGPRQGCGAADVALHAVRQRSRLRGHQAAKVEQRLYRDRWRRLRQVPGPRQGGMRGPQVQVAGTLEAATQSLPELADDWGRSSPPTRPFARTPKRQWSWCWVTTSAAPPSSWPRRTPRSRTFKAYDHDRGPELARPGALEGVGGRHRHDRAHHARPHARRRRSGQDPSHCSSRSRHHVPARGSAGRHAPAGGG